MVDPIPFKIMWSSIIVFFAAGLVWFWCVNGSRTEKIMRVLVKLSAGACFLSFMNVIWSAP